MKQYTIGIGCIGSGVGQSIIDSCNLSSLPLKTIGFGTNPYAFGAYECTAFDYTSSIYSPTYIDEIIQKCKVHNVDLFIPGHDDEAFILAKNLEKLGNHNINALVSCEPLLALARNKDRMCTELSSETDSFVRTFDAIEIKQKLASGEAKFPLIAKPRGGFASRGIQIINNYTDLDSIVEGYIIQELAIPEDDDPYHDYYMNEISSGRNTQVSEISIQIVVDKMGHLMGRMSTYNKLSNGVPIEITPYDNPCVWDIIDKLMPKLLELGLRGPINIQGRMTNDGFKIFEMNPRFTGITGLRALMGFNEVEACIKSWLHIPTCSVSLDPNLRKVGLRQTTNKTIPVQKNERISSIFSKINKRPPEDKKVFLVTGADGFLGSHIIRAAMQDPSRYRIVALCRNKDVCRNQIFGNKVDYCDYNDLADGALQLGQFDGIIHCAFARPYRGSQAIAESLSLTLDLFTRAAKHNVPAILNISSQSVYGNTTNLPWNEEQVPVPMTIYGEAKFATERFLEALTSIYRNVRVSSLRLSALAGYDQQDRDIDLLSKFVRTILEGKEIVIEGGTQMLERLDVRDAADAILTFTNTPSEMWSSVYNVGPDKAFNIKELGQTVIECAVEKGIQVRKDQLKIIKSNVDLNQSIDSTRFRQFTGWRPSRSIRDTINMIFDGIMSKRGKDEL